MTWGERGRDMPSNWSAMQRVVLTEEPTCQLAYPDEWVTRHGITGCSVVSAEVDHIGDPTDHSRRNLRGVCSDCHKRRTQEQAKAALQGVAGRARYPEKRSPGLL